MYDTFFLMFLFLLLSKKLVFHDRFPCSVLSCAPLEGHAIILLAVDITAKLKRTKPLNTQPLGNLGSTILGHPWMLLVCIFQCIRQASDPCASEPLDSLKDMVMPLILP